VDDIQPVVEIHVPLVADPQAVDDDPRFGWIDTIEEHLAELEGDDAEPYDDGEEWGDEYVFFLTGDERTMLTVAATVAQLSGVPAGVYAMVTDSDADELGLGRRVDLT
jgi:hypothetical protein